MLRFDGLEAALAHVGVNPVSPSVLQRWGGMRVGPLLLFARFYRRFLDMAR